MLTGNRVNVGTIAIALFREIEQCPDLVEGKAEIAGAADEAQTAKVPTAIAAIGTARQRNARGIAGLIVRLEFQMGSFSGQCRRAHHLPPTAGRRPAPTNCPFGP